MGSAAECPIVSVGYFSAVNLAGSKQRIHRNQIPPPEPKECFEKAPDVLDYDIWYSLERKMKP